MGGIESIMDLPEDERAEMEDELGLMAAAPEEIVEVAPDDEQAAMLGVTADEEMV